MDQTAASANPAVTDRPAGKAPPCTMVIFGAAGDLTKRLLMPAIYNLVCDHALDDGFRILGLDIVKHDDDSFRKHLTEAIREQAAASQAEFTADEVHEKAWSWLMERCHYMPGDFGQSATFTDLQDKLDELAGKTGTANAVFYLAVAPRFFSLVIDQLGAAGLLKEGSSYFRRIVIEKPFGTDLASARALNARILSVARESQIFRIDHYLGKETVQNIMVLRFANGLFEPIWNRDHIAHVQITAAETVGVEQRGGFYDTTGALRDMVPNHIFQLLAMIAMEPPNSFEADAIRTEKAKVIEAIRNWSPEEAARNAVRGQYTAGTVRGKPYTDYRREPHVAGDSRTETYVAMKLLIDNWRWSGVPFYLRTGKAMAARRTEVAIQFNEAPGVLFRQTHNSVIPPNMLIFRIQPNEGVSMRFIAKKPGRAVVLKEVQMDFNYADYFESEPSTGYETLIFDCLTGDATLFQRADNIEAGWAEIGPLQQAWAEDLAPLEFYPAGSQGPAAADQLLARDGFQWVPVK